jgi:hypothetical protein
MSLKITHKNSTTAGTPPSAGDIDVGEIAMNAADAELYTKDTAGNIRKFQNTTTGTAAGVQFTQAGTGAVERTVESKLQDVVSVEDFGAAEGASDVNAATNTAAFIAALKTGKTVFVPKGEYRINQIDCTANAINIVDIIGEFSTIKRVGGGATFYISAAGCNLKIERVTLSGDGTGSSVHYDYSSAKGKQVFRHCGFVSDQYGLNVETLAVAWVIEDCTFNGLSNTAQYFVNGAWGCRFENNYTWFCNKGFYVNGGHGTSYRSSVFEYNSSEAVIIENNGPSGNDITDFVFDSIFFESNAKDNAVPITRIETTFAARIRNISFRNCYYTVAAQATYYCEITAGASGSIFNVLFDTCTFNAGGALAPTNTNSSRVNFLNCYFNDSIAATAIQSANKKYVPINGDESPVVTVNDVATVGSIQTDKLTILQDSNSAIELRPRIGTSTATMFSAVSLLYNVDNGVNTVDLDLPSMLDGSDAASEQRVYLVTSIGRDGNVNSSSYTRIITMYGPSTAGINVTSLSTVNVGTAANVTFTRTDPGGGAPHQLTLSGNNVNRVKSVNVILLGRN